MSVTNVRRMTSKQLMRYQSVLNESGKTWEDVEWSKLELESGPGGDMAGNTVKIINSYPVWKEVFEEQRRGIGPCYCDMQIHGSDGYVPAHVIYLQHASKLVDSLIKAIPPGVEPPTPQNFLGITLTDVKVDHIRTVLSLLYSGAASVDRNNWGEIRRVMDMLQMNDVILKEEPLNQSQMGGRPNKFRQVLIYRLRDEPVPNLGTPKQEATRRQLLAILPPVPPSTVTSSSTTANCQPSIFAAKNFASKSYSSISTGGKNFNKKKEKVTGGVVDDRYPKRLSKPMHSYNENQDSDLESEHEIEKKEITREVGSTAENCYNPPHDEPEKETTDEKKEEKPMCYFCNIKFKNEDKLDFHLKAQCARSLEEFFDLEDRFCYSCKCSYKDHNAAEFISHVGTCVGTMRRRRGRKRKSTSNKFAQDEEDKDNSDEDSPPVETYQATMAQVCVDQLSENDVAKVMNMIENGKSLNYKRPIAEDGFKYAIPEGQASPAEKAHGDAEAAKAILIEIEQAKKKKRGPKSRTIGITESSVLQARPQSLIKKAPNVTTGNRTQENSTISELIDTKIVIGEEILFIKNSNNTNTNPAFKTQMKDSTNSASLSDPRSNSTASSSTS